MRQSGDDQIEIEFVEKRLEWTYIDVAWGCDQRIWMILAVEANDKLLSLLEKAG